MTASGVAESASPPPAATRHDDFLDGVRGLAILIVVAAHGPLLPWEVPLLGRSGVYLFFVLSAFLLTRQLYLAGLSFEVLARYFTARVFRIYPLFVVVLLYEYFIGFDLQHRMPLDLIWRHLTLREGFFVYWTIVVEFQYYFIIPLLVACFLFMKRWPMALAIALLLAYMVARRPGITALPPEISTNIWIYLPIFLFGSFAGIWAARDPKVGVPVLAPVLALLCIWLTLPDGLLPVWQWITDRPVNADKLFPRLYFLQGLFWTIVLLGGFHPFWRRLFENPVLRFYGRISFSLYLFHQPVQGWIWYIIIPVTETFAPWNWHVAASLYVAIPTALAYASYRYFEQPTIQLGKRLGRWLAARSFMNGSALAREAHR